MDNTDEGMFDVVPIKVPVRVGSGQLLYATKLGKKRLKVKQGDKFIMIILDDYEYVPGIYTNLLLLTKCVENDWNLGNDKTVITITKASTTI